MLKFIEGSGGWRFIEVSDSDVDEAILYISTHPTRTSLYLNAKTCESGILNRITKNPKRDSIKSLHLMNTWDDVKVLEKLSQLENLNFGYEKSKFDFSEMPKLKSISGVWSPYWSGLDGCLELEEFSVSKYKKEIVDIPLASRLKTITLIQPALSSLDGIECAESLHSLEIVLAKNLVDIDSISSCKKSLKNLSFDGCKKIISFDEIAKLESLESLRIAECLKINSITFISKIPGLKLLSIFETYVIDDDLSVCMKHPSLHEVRSEDRKSYIPRIGEVKDHLARRLL